MRILIFRSKRLSYDSSWCFAEMLCRSFRRQGCSVNFFLLSDDIAQQERELKNLTTKHFDAVFDINSMLPNVMLDDDYYLDLFDAPFYHMIVDHPMHVHYSLNIPLKNYHVLCLDRHHQKYIEQYYPHIKKVHFFPFGGIPADEFHPEAVRKIPSGDRQIDLLFPGTYTPLDYYRQQIEAISSEQWKMAQHILSLMKSGCEKEIDELYRDEILPDTDFFPLKMYKSRLIDRYIREWYRQSILQKLLQAGIHIHVMGFRWEMFHPSAASILTILPPCSYARQLQVLSESKMVLNIQPLFLDGPHDRIMNTMINHSVAVTDQCTYMKEYFIPQKDYIAYNKNDPEGAADQISILLRKTDRLDEIIQNGCQKVSNMHTWEHRIKKLL